jgi:transcriptional regulator with XRE-family HTH domain
MAMGGRRTPPEGLELAKHIGKRLRWVRDAYGKPQAEMAAMVGVSQASWAKWELGKRMPDRWRLPELAMRLKVSEDYLLGQTLYGVERNLAIRIAAAHPELALA